MQPDTQRILPRPLYTTIPPADGAGHRWVAPKLCGSVIACLERVQPSGANSEATHRGMERPRAPQEYITHTPRAISQLQPATLSFAQALNSKTPFPNHKEQTRSSDAPAKAHQALTLRSAPTPVTPNNDAKSASSPQKPQEKPRSRQPKKPERLWNLQQPSLSPEHAEHLNLPKARNQGSQSKTCPHRKATK